MTYGKLLLKALVRGDDRGNLDFMIEVSPRILVEWKSHDIFPRGAA